MLDGKVAIVTGGATGLGRCHALELARLGARVVVNDLGVAGDGSGRNEGAARAVCDEIKSLGGEAVPHFGDVAEWNASKGMFDTALSAFGDVNVVVCNAGFLRDATLFNMTEQDFDAVVRVHLKGHFCALRHATVHWRERAKAGRPVYGRIISTSSESAFFAPPGQPNYSAAKAGIVALTLSTAQGLSRYGVRANAICPRARTAMTADTFNEGSSPGGLDVLAPERVATFVGYLASPASEDINGQVFVIYGDMVALLAPATVEKKFTAADGIFSVDEFNEQVTPHFEGRGPYENFAAYSIAALDTTGTSKMG